MKRVFFFACLPFFPAFAADFSVHSIFSDNAVLQRDKPVSIFGTAKSGTDVVVRFADQSVTATTDDEGNCRATLAAMAANAKPQILEISNGDETKKITNVLVGEVWVLGGQSNMEHEIHSVYDGDLEMASANYPNIRLLTVPRAEGEERRTNFEALNEFNAWSNQHELKGSWAECTPDSVKKFAAIGYIFGRRIHLVADVPVGLIDVSRGGTTVETWTSRETLETVADAKPLLDLWDKKVADFDPEADLAQRIENWKKQSEKRKAEGQKPHNKPEIRPGPAADQNRPASCFNGMLATLDGVTIRGAIFNQGYNNALGDARPALYAQTIQAMIRDWQTTFRDEKLPFGIIGLTAGGQPQTDENFEVRMIDAAPFIREAQHRAAQEIEGVEFFPAWDQQMAWYHPFKKVDLGERTARWALAEVMKEEGSRFPWKPAEVADVEIGDGAITLTFDHPVQSHDGRPFTGFAIAGEDRRYFPAEASWLVSGKDKHNRDQHDRKKVVVSSPHVKNPVAVRHAWARNPVGNLTHDTHHLRVVPVPAFRTDDWPYPDAPFDENQGEHRKKMNDLRRAADAQTADRKMKEAQLILESAD